jgi:CRP/FNR family cyclic AMP-dependent transcriptional regulator
MADTSDDLARVPLFAGLGRRQLKKLAGRSKERTVPAGTIPVQEGKMSGVGFFVVVEGQAAVSVGGKDVATLGPGSHFGELALISEAERTATVTATTELRLLEIPFYDFRDFAHENPDVMWKLLQHVVATLYGDHE